MRQRESRRASVFRWVLVTTPLAAVLFLLPQLRAEPSVVATDDLARAPVVTLSGSGLALDDRVLAPRGELDAVAVSALREALAARRASDPAVDTLLLTADEGIPYREVTAVVQTAAGVGFVHTSLVVRPPPEDGPR